ncbi:50S ribosome-binding GTPase [Austwickia chelonae]|uniref:G domain-containing protein n=1 Tax=Austwickia chelonae NBRC 105200 TaxID=1184607 RepID=K6VKX8_9MICO|nr:GTPase [Austwickia chelonae]GAB77399.1 hypothetical protein AUCHE_05_03090 [Austwickia chelonae NBRC 105200]SEW09583.1 50S ribosome-binding GTPase [Austwickia chelonae]
MRRRQRHATPSSSDPAVGLKSAVEGLTGAIDAGGKYLPPQEVSSAEAVLKKASERLALSGKHTVVAFTGATGTGKSSLFNAMVGREVSRVGALRPTTSRVSAAIWGEESPKALLDWIGADVRHRVSAEDNSRSGWSAHMGGEVPDGLVLLDLPDIDSLRPEHRAEADRVLDLVDVFVWITDPQKYADAVLHDEYLRKASQHQTVTLVVLNQADRMATDQAESCREDLRKLLADDGLTAAEVLLLSARTGEGVGELRDALSGATKAATAARSRLLADVKREAETLVPHVGTAEASVEVSQDDEVVTSLSQAAGIPTVLDSVAVDYRNQAYRMVSWPLWRWVRKVRPDAIRMVPAGEREGASADVADLLGRTSLPEPTPAARAEVERIMRSVGSQASRGLPPRWARAVQDASSLDNRELLESLDSAVLTTPLRDRAPMWWYVVSILQWVLMVTMVGATLWLLALTGWSFLSDVSDVVPQVAGIPLPTVLIVLSFAGGVLLALGSRPFVNMGAARRRADMEMRLSDEIGVVAVNHLLSPVQEILEQHRRTREHLGRVRSA